jgi:hypothetical protein
LIIAHHPMLNSTEWTSVPEWAGQRMDALDFCSENSELCRYVKEQVARQKFCYHQRKHGIDPNTFEPDLSFPVFTEDMNTFVWLQAHSEGPKNETASELLRMEIFGDVVVTRDALHGLDNTSESDVREMLECVLRP